MEKYQMIETDKEKNFQNKKLKKNNELPDEILFEIFSFLSTYQLIQLSLVNSKFLKLSRKDFIWEKLFKKSFSFQKDPFTSYFELYKENFFTKYNYDNQASRYYKGDSLVSPFETIWTNADILIYEFEKFCIFEYKIYYSDGGTIICLDIRNGKIVWSLKMNEDCCQVSYNLKYDCILVSTQFHLFAFDKDDGNLKWKKKFLKDFDNTTRFIIKDGIFIYCTLNNHGKSYILGLDPETLDQYWEIEFQNKGFIKYEVISEHNRVIFQFFNNGKNINELKKDYMFILDFKDFKKKPKMDIIIRERDFVEYERLIFLKNNILSLSENCFQNLQSEMINVETKEIKEIVKEKLMITLGCLDKKENIYICLEKVDELNVIMIKNNEKIQELNYSKDEQKDEKRIKGPFVKIEKIGYELSGIALFDVMNTKDFIYCIKSDDFITSIELHGLSKNFQKESNSINYSFYHSAFYNDNYEFSGIKNTKFIIYDQYVIFFDPVFGVHTLKGTFFSDYSKRTNKF